VLGLARSPWTSSHLDSPATLPNVTSTLPEPVMPKKQTKSKGKKKKK